MSQSNNNSGGISFLGALQLIFVVLKLVGVVDWSWWLVMIPSFVAILIIALFIILYEASKSV